jgi:hypothetical protein
METRCVFFAVGNKFLNIACTSGLKGKLQATICTYFILLVGLFNSAKWLKDVISGRDIRFCFLNRKLNFDEAANLLET